MTTSERSPVGRRTLGTFLALFLLATASACQRGPDAPRNIILISIDTLNADLLPFDPEEHPNLSVLAQRSLRFTRAVSTAPWTLPSHASLLTGLYPDRHGATALNQAIDAGVSTLAEILHRAGFETIAFTGGGYLDPVYGFDSGFDRYDDIVPDASNRPDLKIIRDGRPGEDDELYLFDRAIEFLEQHEASDPPLFLFLHTYLVHDYFSPSPWARKEVEAKRPGPVQTRSHFILCLAGRTSCSRGDWSQLEALYRAEVHALDARLGELYQVLSRKGLVGDSLILLVSDHGEGFDPAARRIHHGGRLTEELIRIPFLVSGPGIEPGVSDSPVSLIDVVPTVLAQLKLPVPPDLDGRSFDPVLRGEALPDASRALIATDYFYTWNKGARVVAQRLLSEPLSIAIIEDDLWFIASASGESVYDVAVAASPRGT